MSKRRYGRNSGSKRSYLKHYSSDMVKPTGKSISHSARTTRQVLRDGTSTTVNGLGTTDWGYIQLEDTPFHKGCDECHCTCYKPKTILRINEKGQYPYCKCGHGLRDHNRTVSGWPDPQLEVKDKSKLVAMGGNPFQEWTGSRHQGADPYQKMKIETSECRYWMFFSGNRVFFVKAYHLTRKAQISNVWFTTTRAMEALKLGIVSWQEEVDYEKALKGEFG